MHAARCAHIRDKSRCRDEGTHPHIQPTRLKSVEISARVLHLADATRRDATLGVYYEFSPRGALEGH